MHRRSRHARGRPAPPGRRRTIPYGPQRNHSSIVVAPARGRPAAGPAARRRAGRRAAATRPAPGTARAPGAAGRVAVLQVGQLLGEHHRWSAVRLPYTRVKRAGRLDGQRGGDQRQHRGDAGAGRRPRRSGAPGPARTRVVKCAQRRQHLDACRRRAARRRRTPRRRRRGSPARRSAAGRAGPGRPGSSRSSTTGARRRRRRSTRRTVRCWPAGNAKVSRSSSGTAKVIATESSVSRSTAATGSGWKAGRRRTGRVMVTVTAPSGGRRVREQARQRHSALHAVEPNRLTAARCPASRSAGSGTARVSGTDAGGAHRGAAGRCRRRRAWPARPRRSSRCSRPG